MKFSSKNILYFFFFLHIKRTWNEKKIIIANKVYFLHVQLRKWSTTVKSFTKLIHYTVIHFVLKHTKLRLLQINQKKDGYRVKKRKKLNEVVYVNEINYFSLISQLSYKKYFVILNLYLNILIFFTWKKIHLAFEIKLVTQHNKRMKDYVNYLYVIYIL